MNKSRNYYLIHDSIDDVDVIVNLNNVETFSIMPDGNSISKNDSYLVIEFTSGRQLIVKAYKDLIKYLRVTNENKSR